MGISVFRSSACSSCQKCSTPRAPKNQNPNPARFRIERIERIGAFMIAEVRYPDCVNYEGRKVLVYHGVSVDRLIDAKRIDPHFTREKLSPVARFEPTESGWAAARIMSREYKRRGIGWEVES